jgi:hypothetical protein
MSSCQSNRGRNAAGAIFVLSLLCGVALCPASGNAAGALAVALPPDVAKGGFSYGYSNDNADVNHAEERAQIGRAHV